MVDCLVSQESLTENIKTNTHSYMITILRMSSRISKWLPKEEFTITELKTNKQSFWLLSLAVITC